MFHPSRYGGQVKLTPIVKNKWSCGWANNWFYYRVLVHKTEVQGKGVYLMHSEMNALDYLMEMPHNCATDDANAMAFKEVTEIIGGHNLVEEFLACGIWLLSDGWDFEVERTELPLLKVTALMPKVTAIIAEWETGVAFQARITSTANQLGGNYGSIEHRVCTSQLHHGHLSCVFYLAGVNYQSKPEPIARVLKNTRLRGWRSHHHH
jgi:hypothetical protein